METKKTHISGGSIGKSISPTRYNSHQDIAVFKSHISSNSKMISNLENEFKGIKKLDTKLTKNPDLEFQLLKQIDEINEDIYCERARQ